MSDARLNIRLTADQQKQVMEATGKTYTELTFDLSQTGKLTEKALGAVVGGIGEDGGGAGGEDLVGGGKPYSNF